MRCRPEGPHYVLISLVALASACRAPQTPAPETKPAAPLQSVRLNHPGSEKVFVGTEMEATAEGLPPGRKVDLLWKTVNGGWVIEDYYHFRGKKVTETSKSIGQVETDDNGRLFARFKIPADYGGVHELIVSDNGTPIAQGGVECGVVTSGAPSPTLGKSIGLGYVPPALAEPGTRFEVMVRGRPLAAQVVETPCIGPAARDSRAR